MTVQMSNGVFSGTNDLYEEFILWLAERAGITVSYDAKLDKHVPNKKNILDPVYFLVDNMWEGDKIPKESHKFLLDRLCDIRLSYLAEGNVETVNDVLKRTNGCWNVTKITLLDEFIKGLRTAISKKRDITYR